jgi:hypothetical protein
MPTTDPQQCRSGCRHPEFKLLMFSSSTFTRSTADERVYRIARSAWSWSQPFSPGSTPMARIGFGTDESAAASCKLLECGHS